MSKVMWEKRSEIPGKYVHSRECETYEEACKIWDLLDDGEVSYIQIREFDRTLGWCIVREMS